MKILKRRSKNGKKTIYYESLGRGAGQRATTKLFTYNNPKTVEEKEHNREILKIIKVKEGQAIIEQQAIGTPYIPKHKFKGNFFDYYEDFVNANKREGNRHIENSLTQFKKYIGKSHIAPIEINENTCKGFRTYLADKFTGETPLNYFSRFKRALDAATVDGYYKVSPADKVAAKSNPSKGLKENLEVEEYLALINTPCTNDEMRDAFIFCCYTGLRWCDIKTLSWLQIKGSLLTTRMRQAKTGEYVVLTLHPTVQLMLEKRMNITQKLSKLQRNVFSLPSANGANKGLSGWVKNAGIDKYITWSCARLSFSILLQDKMVDNATVALLLGHTTSKYVERTYKRYRVKNQMEVILKLPAEEGNRKDLIGESPYLIV